MSSKLTWGVLVAVAASLLTASVPADRQESRFFEMRTYTARDGTLDLLHKRFRDHTNRLFVKHGMDLVGYWTPTDGQEAGNTLVYILAYPNRQAREDAWASFLADPQWREAYRASREEAGGPIVANVESTYLTATDYSPIR